MKINYRKRIVWLILSLYLMLTPVTLNIGNIVLCFADDCHADIACESRQDQCMPADDSCRESNEYTPQLSDSHLNECFCCVEIPFSTYTNENTPLSRHLDPSGKIQTVLAQSLPDSHPLLNKALFSPASNPHLISTQKTLRSVILIV